MVNQYKNSPKVVQVILNTFGGQVGGSHFLKEAGLLQRDPSQNDWDIFVPTRFIPVVQEYLRFSGWSKTIEKRNKYNGIYHIEFFQKEGVDIDLFPYDQEITVAKALQSKAEFAKNSDLPKESQEKHARDLRECFEALNG